VFAATACEQHHRQSDNEHDGDERYDLDPGWSAGRVRTARLDGAVRFGWHQPSFTRHFVVVNPACRYLDVTYAGYVPKLWTETIEAHRSAVRDATLDTTAALVARHGLRSVTMSQIAEETGIGRATLYKYFRDVDQILLAWHERQVAEHLHQLKALAARPGDAGARLAAVLESYALIQHEQHGSELAAVLHAGEHVARAREHLRAFLRELLADAARSGLIRDDIATEELASYCLHALGGASGAPSKAAVRRLVALTLAGLRPAS
jgi:AcrR family transcriptional regulator